MKLTKKIIDGREVYFENGVKKYEHRKNSSGFEWWREYDSKGNIIHYKTSNGFEWWREYDSKGNNIHSKYSNGYECWSEYDNKGNQIHFKDSNGTEWRKKYNPEEEVEVKEEVNIEPFTFK